MAFAVPAAAVDPPDGVIDFPAGSACSFALHVELRGGKQVYREFFDKNDNLMRWLFALTGSALTFMNATPGSEPVLSLKSNGFSEQRAVAPAA